MITRRLLWIFGWMLLALGAQGQVAFQNTAFAEVLALAKREGKLVFLDAVTATCSPCKRMARETFTDPAVADLFNARFVNLRMDLNLGEGPAVQERYNITDFPTLLILDSQGELVEAHVGFLNAAKFLAFGQSVLAPDFLPLSKLEAKYAANPQDRQLAAAYIVRQSAAGRDIAAAWEAYRPGMAGEALLRPENWEVFCAKIVALDAPESSYFLAHRRAFEQRYGAAIVTEKFFALHNAAMRRAIFNEDAAAYAAARKSMVASQLPNALTEARYLDLQWKLQAQDWAGFFATAMALDSTTTIPTDMLDWIAAQLCDGSKNAAYLKQALVWSGRAVAQEANYAHLDTQFQLLERLGRRSEAIAAGHAAIAAAKLTKEPYGSTEEALLKLEAGQ